MNSKVRILALVGSRVLYGQERSNLLLLETLKEQGVDILAVVECHPAFRIIPNELDKLGIAYVEVPYIGHRMKGYFIDFIIGNPIRYLRAKTLLRSIAIEFRPTHIHVPNPFAFLMADSIATQSLPIIYRIGDAPSTHNALWRWVWRRITKRVTKFIVISEFIAARLKKLGVPQNSMSVLYAPPQKRDKLPRPYDRPEIKRHILFIGQISLDKGVDRLIEAFRNIVSEFPDARLTILGRISDWSGDNWQRALRDKTLTDTILATRVNFPGEVDNIYDYLAKASFLVVPSVCDEAFGQVVGEAKAAARPSVVFPSGGLPEQIVHGVSGFICKDQSVTALTEGLRYYLTEPERALQHGEAALKSLEQENIKQFGPRLLTVYQKTLPN